MMDVLWILEGNAFPYGLAQEIVLSRRKFLYAMLFLVTGLLSLVLSLVSIFV